MHWRWKCISEGHFSNGWTLSGNSSGLFFSHSLNITPTNVGRICNLKMWKKLDSYILAGLEFCSSVFLRRVLFGMRETSVVAWLLPISKKCSHDCCVVSSDWLVKANDELWENFNWTTLLESRRCLVISVGPRIMWIKMRKFAAVDRLQASFRKLILCP